MASVLETLEQHAHPRRQWSADDGTGDDDGGRAATGLSAEAHEALARSAAAAYVVLNGGI